MIKNSFMIDLTDGKPTGYSYAGITIEAVHPYTKGFEGPYTPSKPTNAVDDPELATGSNPYWYGKYHKGPRIGKGGLGDGWCSINNGHILKITAQKTNDFREWTTLWFSNNNILAATNKIGFRAYIKLVKGSVVGIGVDAGYVGEARGQIRITKEDCDNSPQGWYYIDEIVDTHQVTLPFYNNFVIGFSKNEDIEAYLALPYAYIPMGSRPGITN
ncbi:MAG: hypothetical protein IE909_18645 [Campylobacterales bacterium]|nr:hypothetical protein [Campylobacterales bacterium]